MEDQDSFEEDINRLEKKDYDSVVATVLNIENILKEQTDTQNKLETIYHLGIDLLCVCFKHIHIKKLPTQAIKVFSTQFTKLIENNNFTLSNFRTLVPNVYHISHHSLNVGIFSCLIGSKLNIYGKELSNLFLAGLLHDIGQYKIDESIINKKGKLTQAEITILQNHPYESVQHLIKNAINDQDILSSIRYHHERLDGSGYPQGLKQYSISVGGQILAISDVFDALITKKSYRNEYSTFKALMMIKKNMGKQFNLKYVDILIKLLK
ncbi:HD domain-containing phosphohydrolase [Sulfurospirillum arcachonense]|uniref:HD-GYP domain-containing protein n=1 Tax=Sulfurospirillum arcachonense TaxID=57666 RepID=UPI00046A80CB